jgi:hypothetical protein
MKLNMTLKGFRVATGILLAALLFAAGNHYLDWGFLGSAGKPVMLGVVLLFILLMTFVSQNVVREMDVEAEAHLEREREWERTRDKSNDQAEAERLRAAIGMPPNKSLDRTREK